MNWKMVLFLEGGLGCWWIKNYIQPPRASWRIIQCFSLPIKAWTIRESNAEILLGATWLIMRQGWSTHQAISKNTPLILLYQTCFFPRKHGTKCVFILRFSSTSAYGILDSDSRATSVTWCYTLKTRLDVRASACIAALAMLLVPGCFGFY